MTNSEPFRPTRRRLLSAAGAAAALQLSPSMLRAQAKPTRTFKLSVITDEISKDFDHACYVAAREFGLQWVELRELWGKNLQAASDPEIASARAILGKYGLRVTDIASPLFKVDFAGAPKSKYSPQKDLHGAPELDDGQQDDVLERAIALAKQFQTDRIRCFDFWRLEEIKTYRPAINNRLQKAAERTRKDGLLLMIENEFSCNTATGREAAATLAGVPSSAFGLNWDPGNAVKRGEVDAFAGGWNSLPKNRLFHCHCKNAVSNGKDGYEWSPVDKGLIDWAGQFAALQSIGYKGAVSLETHWRGAGTPEASTRISWQGMTQCLAKSGLYP